MRTNVVLDDVLIRKALQVSGLSTKKALIDTALKEFVRNHTRLDLRDLRGKIHFSKGYDYKELRRGS